MVPFQHGPQQISGAGGWHLPKQLPWQGKFGVTIAKIQASQIIEQRIGLGETACRSRKMLASPRKARNNGRKNLMSQKVSCIPRVRIALVIDPCQTMVFRIRKQSGAPETQEGSHQASAHLRHRRRTTHSGTTQQIVQHGFRLVVGVVSKKNPVGGMLVESLVANTARCSFHAFPAATRYIDPNHSKRNALRPTDTGAGSGPSIGIRTEPMMNVKRRQIATDTLHHPICGV